MLKTIILGIVQGIGEFLPISSSAHLILVPYLFGWEESSMAFDVALHVGTLLAVLVVFFRDWWDLFMGAFKKVTKGKSSFENKMFWYLVIATVPGALLGFLLDDVVENVFTDNAEEVIYNSKIHFSRFKNIVDLLCQIRKNLYSMETTKSFSDTKAISVEYDDVMRNMIKRTNELNIFKDQLEWVEKERNEDE